MIDKIVQLLMLLALLFIASLIANTVMLMECTPMIGQIGLGESGGVIHCSPA